MPPPEFYIAHPNLRRPVVFTCPLPSRDITPALRILESFVQNYSWDATVSSRQFPAVPETPFFFRIDFGLLDEAEECLARLQGLSIHVNGSSTILSVSHTAPGPSWNTVGMGYSRSVSCAVKAREGMQVPTADVYEILRAYGPLYTFRKNNDRAAYTHYVQFIDDKDATTALQEAHTMSELFSLCQYNPYEIFCNNVPMHVDEEDLKYIFAAYGNIEDLHLVKGMKTQFAFILFDLRSSAERCVATKHVFLMQNAAMPLQVSFSEMRSVGGRGGGKPFRPGSTHPDLPDTRTDTTSQTTSDLPSQTEPTPMTNGSVKMDPVLLQRMAEAWKKKADDLESELNLSKQHMASERTSLEAERQAHAKTVEALNETKETLKTLNETIEDLTRRLSVSDSRRKLMEFELEDRAAWLATQKKREAALNAEREKFEVAKREMELNQARERMKQFQEENTKRQREGQRPKEEQERERKAAAAAAAEAERKKKEAFAKLEELRREKAWSDATIRETQRCINRDKTDWGTGPWTVVKSLTRFSKLVTEMETGRFSESVPFTPQVVPWPILGDPRGVVVKDIEWTSVDDFFDKVSRHLTLTAHKQLLHRVHLMFHPDRWKSKGYLATVQNMEERQVLERAGNVVSQAVAPLWQKSRGG